MGRNQKQSFVTQSFRLVVTALLLVVNLAPPQAYAGDILRGGAVTGNSRKNSGASSSAGSEAANVAKANARDRLARTSQAVASVRALQQKARSSTGSGNVPNGLVVGGLKVLTGSEAKWEGADLPSQSGTTVTVRQKQEQALLHWETFNIGQKTELRFDQSAGKNDAGKWVVFNKVFDPSGKPSQILGSIKAEGQVYVLNQNGIVFGGSSQVNVRALVASALPINDNLVQSGLLNNPDLQFLFSALPISAGAKGTAAFTPPAPLTVDGKVGDVVVEEGAQLNASTTEAKVGGRIALIGPNVRNAGTISAPDGQVILAAGLQVGMTAHPSADPSLRGLDVYVGSVGSYGGMVTNTGEISIPRANATLVGAGIRQLGVIDSTTSVSLNGRIDLLANYDAVSNASYDATNSLRGLPYLNKSVGSVTLGLGSVMRIMPEIESTEQAIGTELALRSQINLQGRTIHFEQGSMLLAPNAKVSAQAGEWGFDSPRSIFIHSGGQIYVDAGVLIDVAGTTGVTAPISQNILEVQLRGAELAAAPLQRDQLLRAVLLTIDARRSGVYGGRYWVGTPLGDATGFLGLVERSVGQLTTAGGEVDFAAGGSVVLQKGATIDVSGGWIQYEGGFVQTTKVLYQGRLVDIANATPDRIYSGIYSGRSTKTHAKWGISREYLNPLALTGRHWEDSYLSGMAGGRLAISAPAMALDADIIGNTVAGPRQIRNSATSSEIAAASELSLSFKARENLSPNFLVTYPTPPRISFGFADSQPAAAPFSVDGNGLPAALNASRVAEVILSPNLLVESGFGSLTIDNSDGSIYVPEGVVLSARSGGAISLTAAKIDIQGTVLAPSGQLTFKALNLSPYAAALAQVQDPPNVPLPNPGRGIFTLGSSARLSAAGLVVDDRTNSDSPMSLPLHLDGGSIEISGYDVLLAKGSVIDVSGGVGVAADGSKNYGAGGGIVVKAGQDPNVLSVLGGRLTLGASLLGYSGSIGGSLSLQAPLIQVGGASARALVFDPDFFNQGGFSHIALTGIGEAGPGGTYLPGLVIAPGTALAPRAQGAKAVPFGPGGQLALVPINLPDDVLSPVSLSFGAIGARDSFTPTTVVVRGDLQVGEGVSLRVEPTASISLSGDTVSMLGSAYAPGGIISIRGATNSLPLFIDQSSALATVYIGPRSVLSAAGTTVLTPDPYGRRMGAVLPGGLINVAGNIVAAGGSVLDVSGAHGLLDIHPSVANLATGNLVNPRSGINSTLYALQTIPTRIDSDGGLITLSGGQMLFSDATLLGHAGGPTALGGALVVSSKRFYPAGATEAPTDINLTVFQSGGTIPVPLPADGSAIGLAVRDSSGVIVPGRGYFSVDTFVGGGFDTLALGGKVNFQGPVSINARGELYVADGGVLSADASVRLKAPYVALGIAFPTPQKFDDIVSPFGVGAAFQFPPVFGSGELTVEADLIDVGTLSLQRIGKASLIAEQGDIRGSGTFHLAGDLLLRAGQIYPVTASPFTIIAYDHGGVPGSVTIQAGKTRPLPLSAGGRLSIYASSIEQHGVLRAPLGSITLGWDGTGAAPVDLIAGGSVAMPVAQTVTLGAGSVTSVSAMDPISGRPVLIPYGLTLDGNSWIDPSGTDISAIGPPSKSISIAGANVSVDAGALIDLSGGGDLYAYRWVAGNGGPVDILGSDHSYAVIPGFDTFFPYGAFNDRSAASAVLGGDPGYVNEQLSVGDRIYLNGVNGLPAGTYTLLPARYALLPGAFLVTPREGAPLGTVQLPDGSGLAAGYIYNGLNASRKVPTLASRFEVLSSEVIRDRAEYEDYFATSELRAFAPEGSTARMPDDAGHLVFQATQSMVFAGAIQAAGRGQGRGGWVDIASASDINIIGRDGTWVAGALNLDAASLSKFGVESLLIGGVRSSGSEGTSVGVRTNHITVDNAGSPLSAPDVVLAARQSLHLADGAEVFGAGSVSGLDTLYFGNAANAGSGDGVLLRVSGSPGGGIVRAGVSSSATPSMTIGAGATIGGASLTLDSTSATSLHPTANLLASHVTLNSGQISLLLDDPGVLQPTTGLILAGGALQDLQAATSLSLLSYSSIDIYGHGGFATLGTLALHAGQIRGFNTGGGVASFTAADIVLDNTSGRPALGVVLPATGALEFHADTIRIGANQLAIDQYADLGLHASRGVFFEGQGGIKAQGNVSVVAPFLTASSQSTQSLVAGGALTLSSPGASVAPVVHGLGAALTLQGASITAASDIILPSGLLTLHATSGDLIIDGRLDVSGTAQTFFDVVRYTDAGQISLRADAGDVVVQAGGVVNVAAHSGGGDAGILEIASPQGLVQLSGDVRGQAGAGGAGGSFKLDVGALPSTADLDLALNDAGFDLARSIRVRTGNVLLDGTVRAHSFQLSADQGTITVTGTVDASGLTGGEIALRANQSVTLQAGALLSVAGLDFDSAGQGGVVVLEAGTQYNGVVGSGSVGILAGSTIDLSVASKVAGDALTPGSSAYQGRFSGKLHLRAPQNGTFSDVLVHPIDGHIIDPSSILVEGYRLYDLTASGGVITTAVQNGINGDAQAFLGTSGLVSANYTAMMNRLLANNAGLAPFMVLAPGAEIINRTGDLTLGSTNSTSAADWNLATYRYGAKSAPGVLTLRAAGNITLYNAISDGFVTSAYNSLLLGQNALLPLNTQSWSYRFAAGADLLAADYHQVRPVSALGVDSGSLLLGKDYGANTFGNGTNALTSTAVATRFQVIRTGTGDIDISAGRNIRLLNQFATIYTAGVVVANPTLGGTFDLPILDQSGGNVTLGGIQQNPTYPVQYTMAGGNIALHAQENIEHMTRINGQLVADSQKQLPNNWLYRRGYVDPMTGLFGLGVWGEVASTTWWVDFSNFFQGVGALGGGNVSMIAGQNINNVDAVIPTNARMVGKTTGGFAIAPDAGNLVELGGGDLLVQSGRDIDAGVYYIERGQAVLKAGGEIKTNATRSPTLGYLTAQNTTSDPLLWLPTTLFLGKGGYDVSARGNILMGPIVNPFLLPGGYNNTFWYKTYFSTYDAESSLDISSLGGAVTMREAITLSGNTAGSAVPILFNYLQKVHQFTTSPASTSSYQPWLRLNEQLVAPFRTLTTIMPGTLGITTFAGDINLVGSITLSPSPVGTVDLLAAGSINGLQPNGRTSIAGTQTTTWGVATINLSDADPSAIPGVATPYAYQAVEGVGTILARARATGSGFLTFIDNLFRESGSSQGALEIKQALHDSDLLHKGDTSPLRLYARSGDVSGLQLFSPKFSRIFSGRDISDVAFYLQHLDQDDVSVIASARDIVLYNASTPLRLAANRAGNITNLQTPPLAGDLQIAGPGTLEVLAGRDLDLGSGLNNSDGTGVGITSIGNAKNPYLPFQGAQIIAAAGLNFAAGLSGGELDIDAFLDEYAGEADGIYAAELADELDGQSLDSLSAEARARVAVKLLYLVLRDSGKAFATEGDAAYARGFAAIDLLFGTSTGEGNVTLRSRDIRTRQGGDISILIPGGGLSLANTALNTLTPPGIVTESGGDIGIFTRDDVSLGIGRIFTLRGGNQTIWSSEGDIAAGSAAKTVTFAPPTRVIIDPQSATVQTDLAGLATGGGIGVLATVAGVEPGEVNLIAPNGTVDAGDAGIRASGSVTIAAVEVLNADNIAAPQSSGVPSSAPPASAPPAAPPPSNPSAANNNAANTMADQARQQTQPTEELPSIIAVEVLGYGGSEEDDESLPHRGSASL